MSACGCSTVLTMPWTPNNPASSSTTVGGSGSGSGLSGAASGKFCTKCFLFWAAIAVVIVLTLSSRKRKEK